MMRSAMLRPLRGQTRSSCIRFYPRCGSSLSRVVNDVLGLQLVNTTYFRLLQINLEGKCKFWTKAVSEAKCNSSATGEAAGAGEEVEGVKPKGKKQCDLDLSGGGKVKGGCGVSEGRVMRNDQVGEKNVGFNAPPPVTRLLSVNQTR
eukprot:753953-Hanusia_phi.AAC.10